MVAKADSLNKDFEQKSILMSEDRKEEKENDLIRKEKELQEFGMKKLGPQNSELGQIQNQLMQPLVKAFADACDIVGKERGFD